MSQLAKPTVLVADDDDDIRELVCVVLRLTGLLPRAVSTGDEALHLARTRDWRMVVLDVDMPGRTGLEICRELKGSALSRLPILLMSAHCAPQDVAAGYAAGADDFLAKPFGPRDLVRRAAELVPFTASAGSPA